MRNNEASASTMSFVTSPVFLGIYMCGVCACCVSFVVIMVWVCWTLVDTYQRGVTEIGCAEQFGIWWFLIGMYLVAIAMTCGRGCADAGTTVALQFSNAELQTIVMWKGFMLLLAYLMQLVFMVVFIAWGTWMWQNMPPRCTARYERDFPDLLLLFHVYVIMLWIGAVVFILVTFVLFLAMYFGVIRQLPPDHPLRALTEPIADVVTMSAYIPIVNELRPRQSDDDEDEEVGGGGSAQGQGSEDGLPREGEARDRTL